MLKKRMLPAALAVTAAALFATAPPALAQELEGSSLPANATASSDGGDAGVHDTRGTQSVDCGGGDTIVYDGPMQIWPPNHKYRDLVITATDGSGDQVTVASTGRHDEVIESGQEMNGTGHTPYATDVSPAAATSSGDGSATTTHQVRGERSGRGEGRTYTFDVTATFDYGLKTCTATFTAEVPHDMRDNQASEADPHTATADRSDPEAAHETASGDPSGTTLQPAEDQSIEDEVIGAEPLDQTPLVEPFTVIGQFLPGN